jgi:hypothetical protein
MCITCDIRARISDLHCSKTTMRQLILRYLDVVSATRNVPETAAACATKGGIGDASHVIDTSTVVIGASDGAADADADADADDEGFKTETTGEGKYTIGPTTTAFDSTTDPL